METGDSATKKTVAVVILNWNGGDDILNCLQSVFASTHKNIQAVIVDNGSVDGSSDRIRRDFPQCNLLRIQLTLGSQREATREWNGHWLIRSHMFSFSTATPACILTRSITCWLSQIAKMIRS